jgi:hypothetical protein
MPRKSDENDHKRLKRRLIIAAILAALLAAGGYYLYQEFKRQTQPVIKNASGSSREQEIPNSETQRFDYETFAFAAPLDWKLIKHETAPYNLYSYRSSLKNADNRYLDIYIDKIPETMAVNKAITVRPQGKQLAHGLVSENCTTLAAAPAKSASGAKPLSYTAKWDGAEFNCDNDNVMRNVVGTSAPGSVNKVTLAGPTTGSHTVFFVYTDHNATPDYSIIYNILSSFTVK